MAWRLIKYLIEGLLDNTQQGKITGWMRFAGKRELIQFDLIGNFHRDIQGAKIYFKGDAREDDKDAYLYMKGFSPLQRGKAGNMTAGFQPADYVQDRVYLEWYSHNNGRVVLEFEQSKITLIGQPLLPNQCQRISAQEQANNLAEFLSEVCKRISNNRKKQADESQPASAGLYQSPFQKKRAEMHLNRFILGYIINRYKEVNS